MPTLTTQIKPSTKERNGFIDFVTLGNTLIGDMVDMGFEIVFPSPVNGINTNTVLATLRPNTVNIPTTMTVDPLMYETSKTGTADPGLTWHINIDCSSVPTATDPGCLRLCVTHPLQAPDNGLVVIDNQVTDPKTNAVTYVRNSGEITSGWFLKGAKMPGGTTATDDGTTSIPFASRYWNGQTVVDASVGAITYSYRITCGRQGFALVVWEEGQDSFGSKFSWIVVQRPVSPATGIYKIDGKQPVFCLYSIGGGEPDNIESPNTAEEASNPFVRTHAQYDHNAAIYWFTVREVDVYRSAVPRLATVDSPDCRLVINAKQQVAITEGNKYVVSFPNGFTTDRYMYKEEIDLITYTSADVISQYSNVAVTVYNEQDQRQYKASLANLPNNTGMRILILTYMAGFDPIV